MKASRRHYDICTNEGQKKNKNGCCCSPFKKKAEIREDTKKTQEKSIFS